MQVQIPQTLKFTLKTCVTTIKDYELSKSNIIISLHMYFLKERSILFPSSTTTVTVCTHLQSKTKVIALVVL